MLRTRLGLGCGSDSESQAVTALPPEEVLFGLNSPRPHHTHSPAHAEHARQAAAGGRARSSAATWDNLGVTQDSLGAATLQGTTCLQ